LIGSKSSTDEHASIWGRAPLRWPSVCAKKISEGKKTMAATAMNRTQMMSAEVVNSDR